MIQFENTISKFSNIILEELNDNSITCWVAGGAVRDHFMGIRTNTDYDLFFPNGKKYSKAYSYFEKNGATFFFENDNAVKIEYNGFKFDLVKKFFPDPIETIDAFDFTVSMFAVDVNNVYHGITSFIDLSKRQLMVNKITYPASSMERAFRYYTKGFRMCREEMAKLFESIRSMDPFLFNSNNFGSLSTMFYGID